MLPSEMTESRPAIPMSDGAPSRRDLAGSKPSGSSKRDTPVLLIVGPRPDVEGYAEQVDEADRTLRDTYTHYRRAGTAKEGTDVDDVGLKLVELIEASSRNITVLVSANGTLSGSNHVSRYRPR